MNTATIQKRKFLNNIYKLFYSSGSRPSEESVRKIFNRYFSSNKVGLPISVDYNALNLSNTINHSDLNELMINSLFNLEVLYECVNENNSELMSTITSLNKKLSNLKTKRRELEAKVDQLIFSNLNSDGFFYSFVDSFANTNNIDMTLSNAFIDTAIGNVTIPKISSGIFDMISSSILNLESVKVTIFENGTEVYTSTSINDFDNVLDGLNDTYWSHRHQSANTSIVSMDIDIPINNNFTISKIEGTLLTGSPTTIIVAATPNDSSVPRQVKIKNSRSDYDRFSFTLNPLKYSYIKLTLLKTYPDETSNDSDKPYIYDFGIRDLFIGAKYHDKRATLVSKPLSIPITDNGLLAIESVALDVDHQIGSGYDITYFVAADSPSAIGVENFNWIAIDPINANNNSNPTSINLQASTKSMKTIEDGGLSKGGLELIDLNATSSNINELNPSTSIYFNKSVYRTAVVGSEIMKQPFILSGINSFRNYAVIRSSSVNAVEIYKALNIWSEKINTPNTSDVTISSPITNQLSSISPGFNGICSGLLDAKVNCDSENSAVHIVTKSREDFNLAIYLNDTLIADLPAGTLTKDVQWNFKKGINFIKVAYDKNFEGLITFNIMSGKSISDYGTLFLDYYSYLDPYEFRQRTSDSSFTFTIDNVFGSREIISSQYLHGVSQVKYFSEITRPIDAVRYRADLFRSENPLVSPSIDSIRIKFKHSEEG
jgi:hypothetical protein